MTHPLLALARAATPGPWKWNDTTRDNYEHLGGPDGQPFGHVLFAAPCATENSHIVIDDKDAAFIAAANPAAIEALCGRLTLLENNLAAYFSARCAHYNGCGDPNYGGKPDGTHAWECPVDVAERALRELAEGKR